MGGGHIHCGHNPWLEARLVDDLRAEVDSKGNGQVLVGMIGRCRAA